MVWHGMVAVRHVMIGVWCGMAWHGRGIARYGRGMVWLGMVGL